MTLCPIALVSSCKKCYLFSYCPLKSIIGDYVKDKKDSKPDNNNNNNK